MPTRASRKGSLVERFWSRVKVMPEGCWEWTGWKNPLGYGGIGADGRKLKAHRVSWVIHFGEIPEGLSVLHRCDNPGCVNPADLFLGTHPDNMRDMTCKKRGVGSKTHCKRGHELTDANVYVHVRRGLRFRDCRTCWALHHPTSTRVVTHCANGHEFTPENTYRRPSGGRDCRQCGRGRVAKYKATKARPERAA